MDLSRITTLHLDNNSPFTEEKPEARLAAEHTFKNGIVVKPIVQNGETVRYTAHDKGGKECPVFYVTLSPNNRCLLCVEDEEKLQSYCIDIRCS